MYLILIRIWNIIEISIGRRDSDRHDPYYKEESDEHEYCNRHKHDCHDHDHDDDHDCFHDHDFEPHKKPNVYLGGKKLNPPHPSVILDIVKEWLTGSKCGKLDKGGYVSLKELQDYLGVNLYNNGELIGSNIKDLDITGEFVKLVTNSDGTVSAFIGPPTGGSHFNTTNSNTDGKVIHDIPLEEMIVPFTNDYQYNNMYGNWPWRYYCIRF